MERHLGRRATGLICDERVCYCNNNDHGGLDYPAYRQIGWWDDRNIIHTIILRNLQTRHGTDVNAHEERREYSV